MKELKDLLEHSPEDVGEDFADFADSFDPTAATVGILANACRAVEWRDPMRKEGVLQKVLLGFDETSLKDEVFALQVLRFLCNCVAENDDNRKLVLPYLPFIWKTGHELPKLRVPALSTLLNLCQDYGPGQAAVIQLPLISDLESSASDMPEKQVLLRLISAIFAKLKENEQPLSSSVIGRMILITANTPRIDDPDCVVFYSCMDALLPILKDPAVQETLGGSDDRNTILGLLENTVIRLNASKQNPPQHNSVSQLEDKGDIDGLSASDSADEQEDVNNFEELTELASELVAIAADIANHWIFTQKLEGSEDDDVQELIDILKSEYRQEWIRDKQHFTSRAAALMLGNFAQSDNVANALGTRHGWIDNIIEIISTPKLNVELRYATAGLVRNLAVTSENRKRLESTTVMQGVEALLSDESVDLRLAGLKLVRLLLRDSPQHCNRFLVEDLETFQNLLQQSSSASDGRTQTEIGRVLVTLNRTLALHRSAVEMATISAVHDLLSDEAAIACILSLHRNPDPRVKSECWLGLAMASSSKDIATQVLRVLKRDDSYPTLLTDVLNEYHRDPAHQKDKENILILVNYLAKAAGNADDGEVLKMILGQEMRSSGNALPVRLKGKERLSD
jgi:hypothetical protein